MLVSALRLDLGFNVMQQQALWGSFDKDNSGTITRAEFEDLVVYVNSFRVLRRPLTVPPLRPLPFGFTAPCARACARALGLCCAAQQVSEQPARIRKTFEKRPKTQTPPHPCRTVKASQSMHEAAKEPSEAMELAAELQDHLDDEKTETLMVNVCTNALNKRIARHSCAEDGMVHFWEYRAAIRNLQLAPLKQFQRSNFLNIFLQLFRRLDTDKKASAVDRTALPSTLQKKVARVRFHV